MLVLTRKPGEKVTIKHAGEEIEIAFVRQHGIGGGLLGFSGPKTFEIIRDDAVVTTPKHKETSQ